MSATDEVTPVQPAARRRAPMTFQLITPRGYGYVMAAVAELQKEGRSSSTEVAAFLAARLTPYDDSAGGALGRGWYPMSVARLLTQVQLHGYPIKRDPDSGLWTMGAGSTREVRDAIAECYRRAAIDDRPRAASQSY